MEKNILVINIGSSSKKYSLYRGEELPFSAHFEKDKETFALTYLGEEAQSISLEVFTESLSYFYEELKKRALLHEGAVLDGIGVRLVATGVYFIEDHIVDDAFLEQLSLVAKEDIAHILPLQKELSSVRVLFGDIKIVAVSDSAFHRTMPEMARNYALPKILAEETGTQRFGYHGISLSSIVKNLSSRPLGLERRVIICHLGSGSSITALLDGKSIDTSMGYSPLEGVVMSSRIGNIDVGAVLHLVEKEGVQKLQEILYKESGLLAVSGLSDDMRVLIDKEKEGHMGAHNAIESFVYAIQKYIGMYISILGGLDLIVFSGTIGERSFILRERICNKLEWCNVHLHNEKNTNAKSGDYIVEEGSLSVCVVHCNEDLEIMQRAKAFI